MKRPHRLLAGLLGITVLAGAIGVEAWRSDTNETLAQRSCIDKVSKAAGSADDDGALQAEVGDCSTENV